MHTRTNTALRLAALLAAATLALTGCGSTAPASGADASATAGEITISDPWVKAADSGMTAGFGEVISDVWDPDTRFPLNPSNLADDITAGMYDVLVLITCTFHPSTGVGRRRADACQVTRSSGASSDQQWTRGPRARTCGSSA